MLLQKAVIPPPLVGINFRNPSARYTINQISTTPPWHGLNRIERFHFFRNQNFVL